MIRLGMRALRQRSMDVWRSGHVETRAYVRLEDGELVTFSAMEGDWSTAPTDIADPARYVAIPGWLDLAPVAETAVAFATEKRPESLPAVCLALRRGGLRWQALEALFGPAGRQAFDRHLQMTLHTALRRWAESNGFEVDEDDPIIPGN